MMAGRTLDQKRNLVKEVTEAVCRTIDTTPDLVKMKLTEMQPEGYAISGKLIVDQENPFNKK